MPPAIRSSGSFPIKTAPRCGGCVPLKPTWIKDLLACADKPFRVLRVIAVPPSAHPFFGNGELASEGTETQSIGGFLRVGE
jgi:hypothetical protein